MGGQDANRLGTTVSLHEVVDALEMAMDEMSSYVNEVTGEIVTLTHEDLRLAEEDPLPDLAAWQQETVAAAKNVLETGQWLQLPSKFDIHEWGIMERFGLSRAREAERQEVADAIAGRGAFRNFKGTVRRLGIEQAWFAYRRQALADLAREWLAQHNLPADERALKRS